MNSVAKLDKPLLIVLLRNFVKQRPNMDINDYRCSSEYWSEQRTINNDLKLARLLISVFDNIDDMTVEYVINAVKTSRLVITGLNTIEYKAGQYWSMEYRAAVCRVLLNAFRDFYETLKGGEYSQREFRNYLINLGVRRVDCKNYGF